MNRFRNFIYIMGLPVIGALLVTCSQESPKAIWNPNLDTSSAPKIERVQPDGTERFYDMEITISGTGFSSEPEENKVYFDNERAVLVSSSPEQIVVRRPVIIGDSIAIKVVVNDQAIIAKHSPYKIEPIVEELGKFTRGNVIYGMAVDKDENVYAFHRGSVIYKISPDNAKSEYAVAVTARGEDIRFGPDGGMYFPGKIGTQKTISRIPAGGGEEEIVHNTRRGFTCLDFDKNGELYACGKKSALWHINVNSGEGTELPLLFDFSIYAMKFTENELYVLGNYSGGRGDLPDKGIYKCSIQADGSLGAEEAVLDWSTTGEYADYDIYGFTVNENGDLYIGTNHPDPLYVYSAGGVGATLYPTLLQSNGASLVWGNDSSLYMMRGDRGGVIEAGRIYRIRTPYKGVPYYGRR